MTETTEPTTEPTEPVEAQEIPDADAAVINVFLGDYLQDIGIHIHILEQVDREDRELVENALRDVLNSTHDIVLAAPSFSLIIRLTQHVDEEVLPKEVVPSAEAVSAVLRAYHQRIVRDNSN